jgi:glutathione synthase/RimK-type ligase-like ATP-grasp enzyme
MMQTTDITILTDARYVAPAEMNTYVANILHEERLVREALEEAGLRVDRINWDHPGVDWTNTRFILFRSTWDYFERFPAFWSWLEKASNQTAMINPYETIRWNLDKHYLGDLEKQGTHIPPTRFIEKGDSRTLESCLDGTGWEELILKPVVSGAARHTYRFTPDQAFSWEATFRKLIRQEAMMIQEFQHQVLTRGEVALMVLGGKFTHAILKKAKQGDFRVQDDFGGTVTPYTPTPGEIAFAEKVVGLCNPQPVYARVDAIWDNQNRLAVSELELIEPELWFRFNPEAARRLASAVLQHIANYDSSLKHAESKRL